MGARLRTVPALAAGTVLLAGAWWATGPASNPAHGPATAADQDMDEVATEQLTTQTAPADLDTAKDTAAEFALALLAGDLSHVDRLAADGYADQLTDGQPRTRPDGGRAMQVDGISTRDLQHSRVRLQVLITTAPEGGGPSPRLEAVTVALVRTDGGWRVTDGAW